MLVAFDASEEVLKALAEIGRTEDVQFSPDGKRLAIAGFSDSRILVLEIETMRAEPEWSVRFSRATTLKSPAFSYPHGVAWADDEVLLVANRNGRLPMVRAPRLANAPELLVHPIRTIGDIEADGIETPGSVALRRFGPDLFEAVVCNNFSHRVTRHFINTEGLAVIASETVIANGLNIPDGIAYSHSGTWVAVSNHYANEVAIYRTDQFGLSDQPVGTLRGLGYAHGLAFTPDDRAVLVADAGAPYVHLFASPDADWTGDRIPASSIRVIDQETFVRGHVNPEEGGPKGLAVNAEGTLLCLTCEEIPLMFVDIRDELVRAGVAVERRVEAPEVSPDAVRRALAGALQRVRDNHSASLRQSRAATQRLLNDQQATSYGQDELSRLRAEAQALEQQVANLKRRLGNARKSTASERSQKAAAKRKLRNLTRSTSWRLTGPLRRIKRLLTRR